MRFSKRVVRLAEKNGLLDKIYGREVNRLMRLEYSQSAVEAIINNYLYDPENEEYKAEFDALQAYRKYCKAKAKDYINILRG